MSADRLLRETDRVLRHIDASLTESPVDRILATATPAINVFHINELGSYTICVELGLEPEEGIAPHSECDCDPVTDEDGDVVAYECDLVGEVEDATGGLLSFFIHVPINIVNSQGVIDHWHERLAPWNVSPHLFDQTDGDDHGKQ